MKRFLLLMLVILMGAMFLSVAGCAGGRDAARDKASSEETYRNEANFERAQDRQRLDHGGSGF
ncbi:MAG TPA: hypothetical protein PLF52_03020 [Syntrophales bacterium]|nr:hypothetical protein [Syntrophales bacterium]